MRAGSSARQETEDHLATRVVGVEGAKHLWVGEKYVRRALDEIVATVRPGSSPLPTTWEGSLSEEAAGATL